MARHAALRLAAALFLFLFGPRLWVARAQDFYNGSVSAETAARAGIYVPSAENAADAIALNPGGLGSLTHLTANGTLFAGLARGSFSNAANDDSRMRLKPGIAPFAAVGVPLGLRWSGGFAITPDLLSSVNWHYADAPGTAGADYGPQAEKSQIYAYRAAAGVAFAPSPRFSLGATLALVYNENTLVAPFIFQSNPDLKGLKTLLSLGTRGLGWGGSVGLTASPARKVNLSAAWSSPITINSHGHASGNLDAQFAALGIALRPDFTYSARVRVKLPQTLLFGGRWQATSALGLSLEADYANFGGAFNKLPLDLSHGDNPGINGLLNSTSIRDEIPLNWSDQYTARFGVDYDWGEHFQACGGYARRSSLVPNGALTPLNGPIMKNQLSGGMEYRRDGVGVGAAYVINLNQSASVTKSGLLAGEFSQSHLTIGTEAVVLTVSLRLK